MNETTKKSNKKIWWGVGILIAIIAIFGTIYYLNRPQGNNFDKTITLEVITDNSSNEFTIETNAEFLRQALEEQNLISGDESDYGLFVLTVDGITVDASKNEWWCFTLNNEMLMTGVDTTPIQDGDHFEATLSTY